MWYYNVFCLHNNIDFYFLLSNFQHLYYHPRTNYDEEKIIDHFYNLLKTFYKLTGVPILVNTSLNLPGEVLVETMLDLKELFDNSKLNYIYLPEINKLIKK